MPYGENWSLNALSSWREQTADPPGRRAAPLKRFRLSGQAPAAGGWHTCSNFLIYGKDLRLEGIFRSASSNRCASLLRTQIRRRRGAPNSII